MSDRNIKLGIIGMSEGNGHPYSWSAIINGYDSQYMQECPFPVIPEYLSKQDFPKDAISNATVSHIWTQSSQISTHIAKASLIDMVVEAPEEMIGSVDAVLLARDDAENHYDMSRPFLDAGLPVFIDKPLATSIIEANKIFSRQQFAGQIFTCSSLRYAQELQPEQIDVGKVGKIKFVDATVPKSWEKYAVHIIEPVINLLPGRGKLRSVTSSGDGEINIVTVIWDSGIHATFKVLGSVYCPISIRVFGDKHYQELVFKDTYSAFKSSLVAFVNAVREKKEQIKREEILEIVEIIEKGQN